MEGGKEWENDVNYNLKKKKLKGTRMDILLLSIEVTGTNPVSKKFPLWVFR